MKRLTTEEKKSVLAAVRENPAIWDKKSKEHSNRSAVNSAWGKVARATGNSEDDCRTTWKSLRDSSRYHAKKPRLSGSACDLEDDDAAFWKYHEDMSFLVAPSSQRITYSTPQEPQERSISSMSSQAEYTYPTKSSRGSSFKALETSAEQMAKEMSALVEIRREGEGEGLKYKELYGYVDVLLRKLPEDEAFLVGTEITALVQDRVKQFLRKEQ